MTFFTNNWWARWITAGLLLGSGFILSALWPLSLIGIGLAVYGVLQEPTMARAAWGSLMAWTIKYLLALSWFWSTYPLQGVGIESGWLAVVLIDVWWETASLWLGLGGVMFAVGLRMIRRILINHRLFIYVAIPPLWLLGELAGSLIFSIITYGSGGSVTTAFSFGYVGYLLSEHSLLLQLAKWGGVYTLGVVAVSGAALFLYFLNHWSRYTWQIIGVLLLVYITSFASLPTELVQNDRYDVAIIETDFSLSQLRTEAGRASTSESLEQAMQAALERNPDYVVLPEDSRYFDQVSDPELVAAQFAFRTDDQPVVVIDSGRANDNKQAVVQSFVYNGQVNAIDQSHKRYLVPQGEFMPALYQSALKLFVQNDVIDRAAANLAFTVGSDLDQSEYSTSSPGILFCFESVSPWGARTIISERGRVPFIAHPTSHAWFHEPNSLWSQLEAMLQVQAVWSGEYIVSSGNKMPSQVFTPAGEISSPELVVKGNDWRLYTTQIPK